MTENLRLNNEAIISTINTNNPVTAGGNVAIKNNDGTLTSHLSPSSENWCSDYNSDCISQSYFNDNVGNATISPILKQDFSSGTHGYVSGSWNESVYSYGNYYNWYSATAGSKGYGYGSYGDIASGSICPRGWMLPYGGSGRGGAGETKGNTSGGYYYLNLLMGGRDYENESQPWRSFPNNFVYSGYIDGSNGKHDRGAEQIQRGTNDAQRIPMCNRRHQTTPNDQCADSKARGMCNHMQAFFGLTVGNERNLFAGMVHHDSPCFH